MVKVFLMNVWGGWSVWMFNLDRIIILCTCSEFRPNLDFVVKYPVVKVTSKGVKCLNPGESTLTLWLRVTCLSQSSSTWRCFFNRLNQSHSNTFQVKRRRCENVQTIQTFLLFPQVSLALYCTVFCHHQRPAKCVDDVVYRWCCESTVVFFLLCFFF